MAELIDRGAACGYFERLPEADFSSAEVVRTLDQMPTVDAVRVVRCKDCKHWHNVWGDGMKCCRKPGNCYYTEADWFCPKGERATMDAKGEGE